MKSLDNRLNLLKNANQIEEDSVQLALKVIELFKEKKQIELNEENGAMLITHLVMANERIKNNVPVEALNEIIAMQIKKEKNIAEAEKLVEYIIDLFEGEFVKTEYDYILMHVLNLIKE